MNAKQIGGLGLLHSRIGRLGICLGTLLFLAGCQTVKDGEFGENSDGDIIYKRHLRVPMFGKVDADDSKFSYLYEQTSTDPETGVETKMKWLIVEGQSVQGIDNTGQAVALGIIATLIDRLADKAAAAPVAP